MPLLPAKQTNDSDRSFTLLPRVPCLSLVREAPFFPAIKSLSSPTVGSLSEQVPIVHVEESLSGRQCNSKVGTERLVTKVIYFVLVPI